MNEIKDMKCRGFAWLFSVAILFVFSCSESQITIKPYWKKILGSRGSDLVNDVIPVDNGYIIAGATSTEENGYDLMVLKVDLNGKYLWDKRYGGKGHDSAHSIVENDYGFIVAGITDTGKGKSRDAWVLKLDPDGDLIWNRVLGGFRDDSASSIRRYSDGFIFIGETTSFNVSGQKIWIVKLDKTGRIVWDKKHGGSSLNYGYDIETDNKGVIILGNTFIGRGHDIYVVKLNDNGKMVWDRILGGEKNEYARDIITTGDGYLLVGSTDSMGNGGEDAWLVKLDRNGNVAWNRTFGSSGDDRAEYVQATDTGFIVAGYRNSGTGTGERKAWIFKVNKTGMMLWERIFKGAYNAKRVLVVPGGYLVAGISTHIKGRKRDIWLVKIDREGNLKQEK